jgi:hypothetical protein
MQNQIIEKKIKYQHSAYSIREGTVIEEAGDKVKVQWEKEFFKNPNREYAIKNKTWVSKNRIHLI